MCEFSREQKFLMRQEVTKQAIRYFLGELSEAEQSEIEERFFADEDYSRFLDAVENDLVDDYVGGKLNFLQKQNFERRFLISERRREAVRSARILRADLFAENEKKVIFFPAWFSFRQSIADFFRIPRSIQAGGFAAVAILVLLGAFWLTRLPENNQTARTENKNRMQIIERTKQRSPHILPLTNENPPDLNKPQKVNQNRIIENVKPKLSTKSKPEKREKSPMPSLPDKLKSNPAFTLLHAAQITEKQVIAQSPNVKNYRFRVVHNNTQEFVSYRVEIHASDGDLLWSREIAVNEKTRQKPLALDVRRGALSDRGSYELTISGATDDGQLEEINSYNFSVVREK